MLKQELHIASLVVHTSPGRVATIAEDVAVLHGAVVHASSPQGKLVVTLEAPTSDEVTAAVGAIQHLDGVLSATMVYQCADSLESMNEELHDAQT